MNYIPQTFFLVVLGFAHRMEFCLMFEREGIEFLPVQVFVRKASNRIEQGDVPGHAVYVRGHLNSEVGAFRFRVEQDCCNSRTWGRTIREFKDGKL